MRFLVASLACASVLTAQPMTESYRAAAQKLIDAALKDEGGMEKMAWLCDRIGHRLSGSKGYDQAVQWAAEQMKRDGLENVATPPVKIPHWVRGNESLEMVEPRRQGIAMLGLGGSVATPKEGITAELIAAKDFDHLKALGREKVAGRIVFFDVPFESYRKSVAYRGTGASAAAKLGAVGMIMRSAGVATRNQPHTGSLRYEEGVAKVPAAALGEEDAQMLSRLLGAGVAVKVNLKMEAQTLPDHDSAQVIGEIRGREKPEEVIVIGGHLDSWDAGTGAHDDASGCIAPWQAVVLMKKLGLRPRRTIRVVLFANEENGLRGGNAYRAMIGDAIKNHVAAIEMDGGAEKPVGFGVTANEKAMAQVKAIGELLDPIGAGKITAGGGGADIGPITREGVPAFGLRTVGERYWEWHHTAADTLDKIVPEDFRKNIAAIAVMSYVLAEMPERLGQ
ncbi:MAG: M20/M25/M40 family metallo-hydrolase [Bryobacteraceae bacterium]|nr:M20/M25/M40 family metallo-hydrolase [Bryobacteraceae bacterium]